MNLKSSSQRIACGAFALMVIPLALFAVEIDVTLLPAPVERPVDFEQDVKPIFERSCLRCHGPERPKSRFRLDNRESALKGGANGPDAIIPGDSANSRLIHFVADLDPDIVMPPSGDFDPLTNEEIAILRAWIDQGAEWSFAASPKLHIEFVPGLRWTSVDGNRSKFREVEGKTDDLAGGIQSFAYTENISPDTTASVGGHALFGDEDYALTISIERRDVGFVRAHFETWREFYDDVGGYAPNLPTNSFSLNRDLFVDVGRAAIDFGLTLPDWPQLVVGYEYQFKDGEKSTLQWGPVGTQPWFVPGSDAKNVYPAFKQINEETHVLKIDVRHELRGWEVEDNARIEFYQLKTGRENVTQDTFGPTADSVVLVNERHKHTSGANSLSVNKRLRDWLMVSSGYLYSKLDGSASFDQLTINGAGMPIFGEQWQAQRIEVSRESQVVSLAGVLGPWSGLALSIGAQCEWTRQDSLGEEDLRFGDPSIPLFFSDASLIAGRLDSRSAKEHAILRWTGLPFTVISAEARLQQEDLGRYEERPDGIGQFTRNTAADILGQDYRIGFTSSPWSRLSLGMDFKRRDKQTDYTQRQTTSPLGFVYPGHILWRDIAENQVNVRLVYRANAWLRTSFDYQWRESDFDSATAVTPNSPGGQIDAARQRANIYSVNAILSPWARLFLSGTLSYTDSRTTTAQNGADYLVPWEGGIYSAMSAVTWTISTNATLRGSYAFTKSDYGQGNAATGLPAGVDYDRHAMQVALTRRFDGNVTATLGYGFYQYREPTLGGAADYRAHAIFAAASFPLP